jgi:hypothetical protein
VWARLATVRRAVVQQAEPASHGDRKRRPRRRALGAQGFRREPDLRQQSVRQRAAGRTVMFRVDDMIAQAAMPRNFRIDPYQVSGGGIVTAFRLAPCRRSG